MNQFFPFVDKWHLSRSVLRESFADMRLDGISGNEGSCLWLGKRLNGSALITSIVVLRGRGIRKEPAFLHVTDDLMFEVADVAAAHDEIILAQIHSHGPGYGVDLSHTDHRYGIRVPYFVSIVAPDYAYRDVSLGNCGVHIFEPDKGYRRLELDETKDRFVIDDTLESTLLTVGGET